MSWFDTSGIASFAKSALKEAQKTLDKALDIKDDVEDDEEKTDVQCEEDPLRKTKEVKGEKEFTPMTETSVWGSFTGSYFEVANGKKPDKLPNGGGVTPLAPLATPETELTPVDTTTGFPSKFTTVEDCLRERSKAADTEKADFVITSAKNVPSTETLGVEEDKVRIRPSPRRNSANRHSIMSNRLSAVSTESEGRKSSESFEVLGSQSATTSPDSELPSISTSSSMGLPLISPGTESVEVIDSLASPSSVEVIPDSAESRDVLSRDVTSPGYSTDSVEVIEELEDELSMADSYTSMSESTGTTMLSHLHRMADSCQDSCQDLSQDLSQASSRLRSGASTPDVLKLSLPSHGSCDLLSASIQEVDWESPELSHTEVPSSTQGSPIRRLLSRSEERISGKMEVCRDRLTRSEAPSTAPLQGESSVAPMAGESMEDSTQSDSQSDSRTAVDSSCEGTLMGSSSDDGTAVGEPTEEKKEEGNSSASSSVYMKELLAEAIGEDAFTRETSPTLSEKSRSDVVKVGSEQTSGHTSGDELETTTSSDIEIISRCSPNGDSSSTASRHSPAKLVGHGGTRHKLSLVSVDLLGRATHGRVRGHHREPSEASSGCSEDSPSEADRLSKKIVELTEVLEAREAKLVELSRSNLELQEKNASLKKQLEGASKPVDAQTDKDELIRELREEGEKLSKMQLKQSNIIKTLRKQEQSQQLAAASYKKQVESLTQELETVKKRLAGKEEVERSQVEKIGLLTGKIGRQDQEIATLLDQLEQAVIKAEQLRIHLDSVQLELSTKSGSIAALEAEMREAKLSEEAAKRERDRMKERDRERDTLASQLEELRLQLKHVDQSNSQREAQAREEKKSLLRRLEEAEGRNEELAQSVSASTRPLLRQLEQLQANANQQRDSWQLSERQLLDKLEEALAQQRSAREAEKAAKQEALSLRSRLVSLEGQLQKSSDDAAKVKLAQEDVNSQLAAAQEELLRLNTVHRTEMEELRERLSEAKKELVTAEAALAAANQRAAQQQREGERVRAEADHVSPAPSSPTLSFGHVSISGSESWPQFADDAFETGSIAGRNLYDSVRGGSSTLLEGLQAQLKMRDGEAMQLQWEMQRRDAERAALTSELASLTARLAEKDEALARARLTEVTLAELRRNYDALLQMHGEKVEEVEELRLDLQDVKDMYKAQIDQLLQRNRGEPPG